MHAPSTGPRLIAVSHRRVLALALPMTLSHVTTPLLGLTDATVIGRLGEAHLLGAVALGAVVFDFIFWSFGGLRMATAGLTAQAIGAGDRREVDRTLARALLVATLAGAALIAVQWPLAALVFKLAGASEAVTQALSTYFAIRIWGAPFTLANYAVLGSVLGRGRSDVGLVLQVAINLANIALTVVFVMGLGWGVAGAALGTILAETAGTALGLAVLTRLGSRPFSVAWADVIDRAAMLRVLAVNRDIMVRNVALLAAFALFTSMGARSGDVTLAANAILYNMFLVSAYFLDGFATAAETLCGQAVGARDEAAFRRAAALSLGWSFGFGLMASLVLVLAGETFIDFVSTNAEVRTYARGFLIMAAASPLLGAAAFAFDGIYTGATWTRAMRDLMLASLGVYVALLAALHGLGNTGLWLALLALLGARGLGQAVLYPRLARRTFSALR